MQARTGAARSGRRGVHRHRSDPCWFRGYVNRVLIRGTSRTCARYDEPPGLPHFRLSYESGNPRESGTEASDLLSRSGRTLGWDGLDDPDTILDQMTHLRMGDTLPKTEGDLHPPHSQNCQNKPLRAWLGTAEDAQRRQGNR